MIIQKSEKCFERKTEHEISCICPIDNNSKIVVGMSGGIIGIYSCDLKTEFLLKKNQFSFFLTVLSGRTRNNGIKILCCAYSYQMKIIEIIIDKNNKNKVTNLNLLHLLEPHESRNEISKAIEINNPEKNIVSIDEKNIIIWKLFTDNNYYEINKIRIEGANDILDLENNSFVISQKNFGIIKFYDSSTFSLKSGINKIETYGSNNYMCKLNNEILCVGGFEYISLISISNKQLINKIELYKGKERITSTCLCHKINEKQINIAVATKYKIIGEDEFFFDIIIFKLNKEKTLEEISRIEKAHDKIINSIASIENLLISCADDKKLKLWNI